MTETDFHFSVMKWLHENGYRFFHEVELPDSRMRPDFLALAPDGTRHLFECKVRRDHAKPHTVRKMLAYRDLLNDPKVKHSFVFPVGFTYPHGFAYCCELTRFEVMYVPFEAEPPTQYARFALRHGGIARYFPSFSDTSKRQMTIHL